MKRGSGGGLQIWRCQPPEQPRDTTVICRPLAAEAGGTSPSKAAASQSRAPTEGAARQGSPAPTAKPEASYRRGEPIKPPPWSWQTRRGDPPPSHRGGSRELRSLPPPSPASQA
jgi:hypothetical protein